ncbi:MAG: ribonuclease J, partial [Acidimicrobiia bacterium]
LREINPQIFGTKLTLGLLKPKLEEHHLLEKVRLEEITAPGSIQLGPFKLRFMGVAHSIPEGVATFVETPSARILHSGDFKLDPSPIDGKATDVQGIAEVAKGGIDLFMSDSTNAQRMGSIPSERTTGQAIRQVIQKAKGRVIVACFASNLHRIQQVVDAAADSGRFVSFLGRSMNTNVGVARELGHLRVEESSIVDIEEIDQLSADKVAVICTGSQGEPLSALSLMAARDHRWIELHEGDTVVLSATPIPGNESAVHRVIDGLVRIGVDVIQPPDAPVHVSGHGAADELKFMLELVKPKWFIPVHGEYRHLSAHARLAQEAGVPKERTLVVEDGDVVEVFKG